jgi:hypothetical protein
VSQGTEPCNNLVWIRTLAAPCAAHEQHASWKCHSAWVTVFPLKVALRRNEESQNCPPDLT